MECFDLHMQIPVRGEYDVIVAGGGVAGAAAALSAFSRPLESSEQSSVSEMGRSLGSLASICSRTPSRSDLLKKEEQSRLTSSFSQKRLSVMASTSFCTFWMYSSARCGSFADRKALIAVR